MKRRFNGNRTSGADGYAYDVENQLVQIEEASSWKTELAYDGRQRLRIVRDYYWSGGTYQLATETRYLYNGMNLIQQRTSSGHPTVTYTRGRDLSGSLEGAGGIGGLLARSTHAGSNPYQPNTHAFYHADGNGNVTYLRRSDGNYAAYKYDPFGRTLATAGNLAAGNLLRFSSKPWIQNSYSSDGLYYYGYRFYDPLSQRWLNRDPIGERGGLNLYGMVLNDPVSRIDVLGLSGTITLNINWTGDTRTDANRSRLQKHLDRSRDSLGKCCKQFSIGCNVKVDPVRGGEGGVPVTIVPNDTKLGPNGNSLETGGPKNGVTWRIGADQSSNTLAHELGHVGGYRDETNTRDKNHSSDSQNLMYYKDGRDNNTKVDKCYCEKVSGLAK